jgi:hypothetical protein
MEYISKSFNGKKILWFKSKNKYLILEDSFSILLDKYLNGISFRDFVFLCKSEYNLEHKDSSSLYENCSELIEQINSIPSILSPQIIDHIPQIENNITITYQWNGEKVCINYTSEKLKALVHPKIQHLAVQTESEHSHIHIFKLDNQIGFSIAEECCGLWSYKEFHLFQGKLSMHLLNQFTHKNDEDWLATLHASAVYKQDSCLVLLGVSGKGKSTATSLLMTNGYQLLADDFVPIEAEAKRIFAFPQAVSIKEAMVNPLSDYFPHLLSSISKKKNDEIQFRYLYPEINQLQVQKSKKCKAFIFIHYSKGSKTKFKLLTKTRALELLIPDSWISPLEKNSMAFLDLILETPCYTLEYSDNSSMLNLMDQLMNDEL